MKPTWMKLDTALKFVVINHKNQALHFDESEDNYGFHWVSVEEFDHAPLFERETLLSKAVPWLSSKENKHSEYTCYEVKIVYEARPVDLIADEERRRARAKLTDREAELLGLD